jgi:imidazolonepropionase-like amidohydrolase
VAPLGAEPIREENVRRFAPEGGDSFSFTPDGSALIYATGHRVWRGPLTGGEPEEVPVRLELRRPTPPPVLIRRVRILDFGTGGFGREAALFIEQGRIRWIGSEAGRRIPPETVTLDADGRYAIPGMFDMHVHASEANQAAFLAYGVTSVRSTADRLDWLNAALDRGEATSDAIPRYFFSGEKFDTSIWGPKYLLVHDEDEARAYVRRHKARNARFIKIYASLPWTLHRAVAEEARRQGLPVIGHGSNGVEEVVKSLILGYASVEHTLLPDRAHADVLRLLAAAGTRWDPTLSVRGGNALLFQDEPERLDDKKLRAFTPSWQVGADWEASRFRNIHAPELRRRWAMQLASIRAAHEQGVNLLAGTDNLFYGSSLHWELEYFVQAGVPPLDVLHIATQQAAEAVGADDDLGTLEVGKLADIVLLDANPLDDIKNTQTIWRVIKGGWVFDPEKLEPPDS